MAAPITTVGAITWREVYPSRRASDSLEQADTGSLVWVAEGSNTRLDVAQTAPSVVPLFYESLRISKIDYVPLGHQRWEVTANYVEPSYFVARKKLGAGEWRVTFDTSGARTKITHSPSGRYTSYGTNAPDYQGAINVVNGKAQGVDVQVPSLKLKISYRHPKGVLTVPYMRGLAAMTPSINNAPYFGFGTGELMFLGATGGDGSEADAELTFEFLADSQLSDSIGGISFVKNPHAYIWVDTVTGEDTGASALRPEVRGVYVHQIFKFKSFIPLAIGV